MNPSVEINIRRTQVAEHRVKKLQAALDIEQYGHETTRKLHDIAVRTLIHHGFTYNGGEMWKPPLGPSPSPLLAQIDALKAERDRLTAQLTEVRNNFTNLKNRWLPVVELHEQVHANCAQSGALRLLQEGEVARKQAAMLRAALVEVTGIDGLLNLQAAKIACMDTSVPWSTVRPNPKMVTAIDALIASHPSNNRAATHDAEAYRLHDIGPSYYSMFTGDE